MQFMKGLVLLQSPKQRQKNWGNKVKCNLINDFGLEAFAPKADADVEVCNDSYFNVQDEDNEQITETKKVWNVTKIIKIPDISTAISETSK